MTLGSIVVWIIIGALAGWLAGLIMRGHGFGLLGNIIVGIIGSFVGGLVFPLIGISASGFIGETLFAAGGAILLLLVIGLIRRV
jgi:uncharacterized membrane protein YeaQ/YmgE (transglycosylase-associated protein family)